MDAIRVKSQTATTASKALNALVSAGAAVALSAACLMGLAACSGQDASGSSSSVSSDAAYDTASFEGMVAATFEGGEIAENDVTDFIQNFRSSSGMTDEDSWGNYLASQGMTPESFRTEVVDYLVSEKLMEGAIEERGITVTDEEVDAQVEQMRANYSDDEAWQTALEQAGTTEEEYRENVTTGLKQQKLQEEVSKEADTEVTDEELLESLGMYTESFNGAKRSSHILFNADDKETAESVLSQLKDGSLKFEDAVSEYSQDTGSAAKGGDVGWDKLTSFVTEYTDALAELEKDEMSDLVESQFGYHIILCTDVFEAPEGGVTSLDQVPDEMVDYVRNLLESGAESNAVYEWYQKLEEDAKIVVNDMPEGLPYYVDMTKYETAASSDAAVVSGEEVVVEDSATSTDAAETSADTGANSTATSASDSSATSTSESSATSSAA